MFFELGGGGQTAEREGNGQSTVVDRYYDLNWILAEISKNFTILSRKKLWTKQVGWNETEGSIFNTYKITHSDFKFHIHVTT